MESQHRYMVIVGILLLAFIMMCGIKDGSTLRSVLAVIFFFGIPLVWLDQIGAGIKWVLEYLVRKDEE